MNIAPAKKTTKPCDLSATLESCQLPLNINQDLGDLWLAWCYLPAKWVSSYWSWNTHLTLHYKRVFSIYSAMDRF